VGSDREVLPIPAYERFNHRIRYAKARDRHPKCQEKDFRYWGRWLKISAEEANPGKSRDAETVYETVEREGEVNEVKIPSTLRSKSSLSQCSI